MKRFKQESIFDFLEEMLKLTKEKGMKNALCLTPHFQNTDLNERKWNKYASQDEVDVLGVDPYFLLTGHPIESFNKISKSLKKIADKEDVKPQIVIQGFLVERGEEETIANSIKEAYKAGIDNIVLWGYKGSKNMSRIRSDNPEKLWNKVGDTFKELRNK